MANYKWLVHGSQTYVWAWFSLETPNGTYEVIPICDSCTGGKETYVFEVTFKGKMVAVTPPVPREKLNVGQAAGRLLAQRHLESKK